MKIFFKNLAVVISFIVYGMLTSFNPAPPSFKEIPPNSFEVFEGQIAGISIKLNVEGDLKYSVLFNGKQISFYEIDPYTGNLKYNCTLKEMNGQTVFHFYIHETFPENSGDYEFRFSNKSGSISVRTDIIVINRI